jgi:hypothetical protein
MPSLSPYDIPKRPVKRGMDQEGCKEDKKKCEEYQDNAMGYKQRARYKFVSNYYK